MNLITGLDHVQVCVPPGGETRARWFYGEVLGLEEIPKPEVLASRGGCWYRCGNTMLHIGLDADFRAAAVAHPGFLVTDLERLCHRLREARCDTLEGVPIPGYRRVETRDPFGNRLEFLQRH